MSLKITFKNSVKKKLKFFIKKQISKTYSLLLNNSELNKGFRVFMYHSVMKRIKKEDIYILNLKLFKEQMFYLSKHHQKDICSLKKVFSNPSKESFVITFDDGYKDNIFNVAPVMENLGLPYTIFITTDYIQQNDKRYLFSRI